MDHRIKPPANRPTNAFRATWFFWVFFLCYGFIFGREGETTPLSARTELIASLAFAFLAALWVVRDARHKRPAMGYGFAALVFFIWPVFGPMYLFQTRGTRAFLSLLAFVVMFLLTSAIGVLIGAATHG